VKYPHRRYLLYLLTRKMSVGEIQAACLSKMLVPPNEESLEDLADELGKIPSFWRSSVKRGSISFRRWLRDRGVLSMWVRDEHTEGALLILLNPRLREDIEVLMTSHADLEEVHKALYLKYREEQVPPFETLERYCEYFWDLGHMTYQERFEFIETNQEKKTYMPAIRGEMERVYGVLGIVQKVEFEDMLQLGIALTKQQMMLDYKAGSRLSGHERAGMAAMYRTAIEAGRTLREIRDMEEGDGSMRDRATSWLTSRVVQEDPIVSFDELRGDVIDAEFAESGSNVRRLPVRDDRG
jgi:hypothetical protein